MSVASSEPVESSVCPVCKARQQGARRSCWLCGASLGGEGAPGFDPNDTWASAAGAPSAHPGYSYSLSTMLLATTLFALCCGLFTVAPGLAIPVSILLVPVLVRTVKVVRRREEAGHRVSTAEKISLGITSFAVTAVIVSVVGFATFCCFCATCAMLFGIGGNEPQFIALAIGVGVAAAAAIFISRRLFAWSRRRYQRDIMAPPTPAAPHTSSDPLRDEP